MTSYTIKNDNYFQINEEKAAPDITTIIEEKIHFFQKRMKLYSLYHYLFLFIGIFEITLITVFSSFFFKSAFIALVVALFFLTFFSYFITRLYVENKKPLQIQQGVDDFLENYEHFINHEINSPEYFLAMANVCCKLADSLCSVEYLFYNFPKKIPFFKKFVERISFWLHWEEVFLFKEHLLKKAVAFHLEVIKLFPTQLKYHAGLANCYVMLSGLYADPRKIDGLEEIDWIPPDRYNKQIEKKFQETAKKAIEEFKILSEYAPNDPWVHEQLAFSYHDLQMYEEEIQEYETINRLKPDDLEALFKLGVLYFKLGKNAKGLQIYEKLKKYRYSKAEQLITFYGS
ncbi:MAG: hypothetical protein BGO10_02330 [Chlamydia sp. 32-24]|nr:MAG: hypothetical protein BGO10_02330 [Chlamydia sp. 32-24]